MDELPQCDTIIGSYSTGAYNSTATIDTICLNRSFPHPLLGLLLGKLDRILGYIYSHGMIWQVNVFALITDFYFPATVLQFLFCFFAFHG